MVGRSTGKTLVKREDDGLVVGAGDGVVADWMREGRGKEKTQRCFLG